MLFRHLPLSIHIFTVITLGTVSSGAGPEFWKHVDPRNISVMPFAGESDALKLDSLRENETASLAPHMIGLYPNSGQSYYLINTPCFTESTLHLADGRSLRITAKKLSAENKTVIAARLNGKPLARACIKHCEILAGGVLELDLSNQSTGWGKAEPPSLAAFLTGQPRV